MLLRYNTVSRLGEAEITEKKSRFIASVKNVSGEEEAKEFIEGIRKKNWNAAHNVFAYRIGDLSELERQSDDGEPQGTSGMPVLEVLRARDVKNTVIVVTRYFGGTLLGTGGLVRAYTNAAKAGLEAAGLCATVLYERYKIAVEYGLSSRVQHAVFQSGAEIRSSEYTHIVSFDVLVPCDEREAFKDRVLDASSGRAEITEMGALYGMWIDGKLLLQD